MDLVKTLSEQYMKPELPAMNVGDTVRVVVKVVEGSRERTQAFEGTIIATVPKKTKPAEIKTKTQTTFSLRSHLKLILP